MLLHTMQDLWGNVYYAAQSKKGKKSYVHIEAMLLFMKKILHKFYLTLKIYILDNAIKKNVYKCAVKTIKTHEKKLRNLTKNVTLPFTDTKTVHNLSNVTLMTEEFELLKNSLKHPTHPLQVNKMDILTFDFIHGAITKDLRDEKQSGEVKTKISNLAYSYVNSYNPTLLALKKHWILKRSANNKDIVILRPDKGSGAVILNRDEYIKKLSDIISDTSKFKKLSADPTLFMEQWPSG